MDDQKPEWQDWKARLAATRADAQTIRAWTARRQGFQQLASKQRGRGAHAARLQGRTEGYGISHEFIWCSTDNQLLPQPPENKFGGLGAAYVFYELIESRAAIMGGRKYLRARETSTQRFCWIPFESHVSITLGELKALLLMPQHQLQSTAALFCVSR